MMALPRIDPLKPVLSRVLPRGAGWVYELKLDGFRGVLFVEEGRGMFTSKTSRVMKRFQPTADELARSLSVKSAIFDGEIIVMGETGPDFNALFERRGRVSYAAFDLLWLNGRDLRQQPLWRRKQTLRKLLDGSPIGFVEYSSSPALLTLTRERDLEGVVAKRKSDPYAPGTEWIKVKNPAYSQMEGRGELFHG